MYKKQKWYLVFDYETVKISINLKGFLVIGPFTRVHVTSTPV